MLHDVRAALRATRRAALCEPGFAIRLWFSLRLYVVLMGVPPAPRALSSGAMRKSAPSLANSSRPIRVTPPHASRATCPTFFGRRYWNSIVPVSLCSLRPKGSCGIFREERKIILAAGRPALLVCTPRRDVLNLSERRASRQYSNTPAARRSKGDCWLWESRARFSISVACHFLARKS